MDTVAIFSHLPAAGGAGLITLGRRWGFAFAGAATTIDLAGAGSEHGCKLPWECSRAPLFLALFFLLAWLLQHYRS